MNINIIVRGKSCPVRAGFVLRKIPCRSNRKPAFTVSRLLICQVSLDIKTER